MGEKKMAMTKSELIMLQSLPHDVKIAKSKLRIQEWVSWWGINNVAISVSGGLDSGALRHLILSMYPNVRCVSIPSIECKDNQHIMELYGNVIYLKPRYSRIEIIQKFGYPLGSKKIAKSVRRLQNPTPRNLKSRNLALTGITSEGKISQKGKLAKKWLKFIDSPFKLSEQCCYYMKEKPLHDYAKEYDVHYFIGTKAVDGDTRETSYMQTGCNSFNNDGTSKPFGFWTQQDVLRYTYENNIPVSEIYGEIIKDEDGLYRTTKANRSGCFICGFGVQLEKQPNRFQRMQVDDPGLYKFAMETLGYKKLLEFAGIPYSMNIIDQEKYKKWQYEKIKLI